MDGRDLGETVVLAFEGDTCDAAVCVPAVDMCEQALFAVCSAATDAMALVARPLQVIVAKQLRGAATATADLMTFMLHKRTDPRNVAALAGVVWQYCTNINAMKLDDKVCALFHRLSVFVVFTPLFVGLTGNRGAADQAVDRAGQGRHDRTQRSCHCH